MVLSLIYNICVQNTVANTGMQVPSIYYLLILENVP